MTEEDYALRISELERQRDQDAIRIHELSEALAIELRVSHSLQITVNALEEQLEALEQPFDLTPTFSQHRDPGDETRPESLQPNPIIVTPLL